MEELKTLGTFGLKTKRELWKAHTELSRVRNQARSLLALGEEVRQEKEPILMKSLSRIGLVAESASLDDVLNLQVTDLLARSLQTITMKNLGFKTPYQARQAVVHGHIMIGDRVVTIPSYTVDVGEEKDVKLVVNSSFKQILEAYKNQETVSETTSDDDEKTQPEQVESAVEKSPEGSSTEKVESTVEKSPEESSTEQGKE